MASIADYFAGVEISKRSQILDMEMIPRGYYLDGVFNTTSFQRTLVKGHYTEKRFSFIGVPAAMANSLSGKVTVKDISGKTHEVSFDSNVTDGSTGTSVFENYNNSVNIIPMSPHLRRVDVVNVTGTMEVLSN